MIYETAKVAGKVEPKDPDYFMIGDFCLITAPVKIGRCSQINAGSKLIGRKPVVIGDHTVISYDCLLITSSDIPRKGKFHDDFAPEKKRNIREGPIRIGNKCYIGAKSVIMPGTVVPDGTVIPAMSYVSGNPLHCYCTKHTKDAVEAMLEQLDQLIQEPAKAKKSKKKGDFQWMYS